MTTIASTIGRGTAGVPTSWLIVTRRALLRFVRTPQLIVLGLTQMSLFLLIYRFMFGGAIHVGGMPYVDFLVPGFIATGVLFSGIGTAVAMAEDLEQGFIDRLRSLPIPRSSVLAGRAFAALGLRRIDRCRIMLTACLGLTSRSDRRGAPELRWQCSRCS